MNLRALGILGGTFDPVHLGHIQSARELCERLDFDRIALLPCHLPPHRDMPQTPAAHRLAMARIAVAPFPRLTVDDRELARSGHSYTVDTLRELRADLGAEVSLTFVMGSDASNALHRWYCWRELFDFANILVMMREGYALEPAREVRDWVAPRRQSPESLRERPAGGFASIELTPWPQSATAVRQRLAAGENLGDCVPAEVETYIHQQGLYRP